MHTLLLADDSITVQRVIALTFAEEPIRVVAVSDGQQAMETIAGKRPDIILAATTLSQVSGYELAQYVRSKAELHEVPVLLLSGAFETVDEAKLKASGANGVIEKPVEPIAVIARVKELLGLKSAAKPATMGRLVTSTDGPSDKKPPIATTPRAVTSAKGTPSKWEQLRERSGLNADTPSVEDPSTRSDTYQNTLDVAFDSLDQQLSGRAPKGAHNPSGRLGHAGGAADPRSPGRKPEVHSAPGNPVFEVDAEWFSGAESQDQTDARAARREISEDLSAPELQMPATASAPAPVFEVDDEWFADDNQARAAKLDAQHQLAAEMGIHDVDPPTVDAPLEPAPVAAHDFAFLDDLKAFEQVKPIVPAAEIEAAAAAEPAAPVVETPPVEIMTPPAPIPASAHPHGIADDFAALLAYEQGEPLPAAEIHEETAPVAAPVEMAAPQITDAMLDQIATRVAERLNAGLLGEQLKIAVTDTVRDTVRSIVSEASERLVRDEIDRIKGKQ